MAKTKAQIIAEAQVVKNATEVGENTATRVGGVLEDLAEADGIVIIPATGTQSGGNITLSSNPFTQVQTAINAGQHVVVRVTMGDDIVDFSMNTYSASVATYIGTANFLQLELQLNCTASSAAITNRSTSNTFSTGESVPDVGIDATPTQGSDNLVKSGGVHSDINGSTINYTTGYYINYVGKRTSDSSWAFGNDYVGVQAGDSVEFNAGAVKSGATLALYAADQTFIGYYGATAIPRTITIPSSPDGIALARLSFNVPNADKVYIKVNGVTKWKPITSNVVGVLNIINGLQTIIGRNAPTTPPIENAYFTKGYIASTSGNYSSSDLNYCSTRIDVRGYSRVQFVAAVYTAQSSEGAVFYDKDGVYISGISYYDATATEQSYKTYDLEIPSNAAYFAYTILATYISYSQQVVKIIDNITDTLKAMNAEKVTWIDGAQISTGQNIGDTAGLKVYSEDRWRYAMVPCEYGQSVYITQTRGGHSVRAYSFINNSNVVVAVSDDMANINNKTIPVPIGATRLIMNDLEKRGDVYLFSNADANNVKISQTDYELSYYLPKARVSNCKSFGTQPAADGTTGSFCNIKSGTYSDLLTAVYEPLRAQFPNYIKRVNIGKDASGTIDMYAYTFEPRYYQEHIYLQAGIHGIEVDAVACLARIMYLIATADGTDNDLMFLRQQVKFTIVPCVNVWGISQSPKVNNNSNDAQLQQWSVASPPTEISNIKTYIQDANILPELSYMLDMHTTTSDNYCDFYGNIQKYARNVRTIFRTNAWLCEQYALDGRTVDDQYLGWYEPTNINLFRQHYYYFDGVQTATLELSDNHWGTKSSSPVITMGVTMWLNYIIQMANDFYKPLFDIPEADYRESIG